MARALVTGGAGFIGSHIVEGLLQDGHRVRVLDSLTTGSMDNLAPWIDDIDFINGDIREEAVAERAVRGMDWVFHMAAHVSVPESVHNPRYTMDVNVRGTASLAYAAAAANVGRFIFASSCAVYGRNGQGAIAEDTPAEPISPYGASKLMGECLLGELHRTGRLPTLANRFFNVYGPRQRADSPYSGVVALFIDRASRGLPLKVYGDGKQTRDFINVKDIAGALIHAAGVDPERWPGVVNLGTGVNVTIHELAQTVAGCMDPPTEIEFAEERRGDLRYSLADIGRAKAALGWAPSVTLEEGIRALWESTVCEHS